MGLIRAMQNGAGTVRFGLTRPHAASRGLGRFGDVSERFAVKDGQANRMSAKFASPSRKTGRAWRAMAAMAWIVGLGVATPATAQFLFDWGRPSGSIPRPMRPFDNFLAPRPAQRPADFSRAPAPVPRKAEMPAERTILVLGDSMADWLAYGLEDAFSDAPEIGVLRKHRTVSGLIRYQPKGAPADWVAAARDILAAEKPSVVVVMLGLNDRMEIREPVPEKTDAKKDGKKPDGRSEPGKESSRNAAKDPAKDSVKDHAKEPSTDNARDGDGKPAAAADGDGREKTAGADAGDDAEISEPAPIIARERGGGVHEFRSEKWVELYGKKIDEMIAVLKTKGVPVLWVGLPALRGTRGASDMLFLDSLYREHASRAGITYVDVWDGFVDEGGRFLNQGPDFEGQIRRLRTADGVYFTKAGARKLAHFAEREIRRIFSSRAVPVALPTEPATPEGAAKPSGGPAPRPIAGPIVPLVAATVGTDELLGGTGTRPAGVDALAARTLVKGEPLTAPAGRADDFSWPRREVGTQPAPASASIQPGAPDGDASPASQAKPAAPAPAKGRQRPAATPTVPLLPGFGSPPPATAPSAPPRNRGNAPRPPAPIGPSASAPGLFTR
jgi:hypothetical protein